MSCRFNTKHFEILKLKKLSRCEHGLNYARLDHLPRDIKFCFFKLDLVLKITTIQQNYSEKKVKALRAVTTVKGSKVMLL